MKEEKNPAPGGKLRAQNPESRTQNPQPTCPAGRWK